MSVTTPYEKRERVCVSHYPPPRELVEPHELSALMELGSGARRPGEEAMYIHIPFCDKICNFCPFNKQLMDDEKLAAYLVRLKQEIALYAATPLLSSCTFGTLAIGGGTPSCLSPAQFTDLLDFVQEQFRFGPEPEISIEGNPSNFDRDRLLAARDSGCNRISFGVQTFNDHFAEMLEIPQQAETSRQAGIVARDVGYDNVGIDLIYNLPGQTLAQWQADVEEAINWRFDHVTLFSLIVPPMTKLFAKIDNGRLAAPGDHDQEVRMYQLAARLLVEAGYEQYSVYDFALPGKINKHAVLYFSEQRDLLGLGAAAFGYLGRYMYVNKGGLAEYQGAVDAGELPVLIGSKATLDEEMNGAMAKGLRLFSVDRGLFRQLFDRDPVDVFEEQLERLHTRGLIDVTEAEIRLTDEGVFWGNNVCKDFFSEKYAHGDNIPREILARGRMLKQGQELRRIRD